MGLFVLREDNQPPNQTPLNSLMDNINKGKMVKHL